MKPCHYRTLASLALIVIIGAIVGKTMLSRASQPDPYERYRARTTVELPGTLRVFRAGSNPDFGLVAGRGPGRYMMIASDSLDTELKPAFRSTGYLVSSPTLDSAGNWVLIGENSSSRSGDRTGSHETTPGGAISSQQSFSQWFREVANVNDASRNIVRLSRDAQNVYVFDGFVNRAGDIPSGSTAGNAVHYTLDLASTFIYQGERGWYIDLTSDAEAWVYVNGKLVLDAGAGFGGESRSLSGIIVDGPIYMDSSAQVVGASGSDVTVATNSTQAGAVTMRSGATIDGDLFIGPGGSVDSTVQLASNTTISGSSEPLPTRLSPPPIPPAPDVGPSVGRYTASGARTISADFRCSSFGVNSNASIEISGYRTIVCDGAFSMARASSIRLLNDSSLTLFVGGPVDISASADLNPGTNDPSLISIYVTGIGPISIQSSSTVCANVVASRAPMTVTSFSRFYGTFFGQSISLQNNSTFTVINDGSSGGSAGGASVPPPSITSRVDLDRLAWLPCDTTVTLRVLIADRDAAPSRVRLATNILTLHLAALPESIIGKD
ncbi:MAG: hypothetical protein AB7G11_14650 [Phycisphaerales bacterium]